jgi:hypothetical protein
MADLPSFFNKPDFFGTLLPGYVAVVLYIGIFQPDLILNREQKIEADLFSIVLLLIAGPVVGGVLRAIHRFFFAVRYGVARDNAKKKERAERLLQYARIRVLSSQQELEELNNIESEYDFRVSTALAITIIALYYLLVSWEPNQHETLLITSMLAVGGLLFYGGYLIYNQRWAQMLQILNHQAIKSNKVGFVYDAAISKFKLV